MTQPIKILIIGNGFGGIYALKSLHKFFHKNSNVQSTLVGEKNYFLFTPLLHEVATGGINPENIIEPIRHVLGCCLDDFYLGKAELINTKEKTVKTDGIVLPYDYLILAPGAQTNFYDIPGGAEYSFTLKSIEDAIKIKNHCIAQMERASHVMDKLKRQKMLRFTVVGGGPTGVEMAVELQEFIKETFSYYYKAELISDASVVLIQRESELMPQFGIKMKEKSLKFLIKKGVNVMLNSVVQEVGSSSVTLSDKTSIPTETVIWVAGIKPNTLEFDAKVQKSPAGQLVVNEYLQLSNHKEIFALGDVAMFKDINSKTPLPALAQVAEKQAKHAVKNIQLLTKGKALKPFYYHHQGIMISLGQWMAIGEIFNFTISGRIVWWIWRTVYLYKLISWRKKVEVAIDWTIDIFSPRDISQF